MSWLKQSASEPLFPEILWSRPENKRLAGKLLIAGGNLHSFSAVSSAYDAAVKAGAGTVRLLLPDALQKTLGKVLPDAEFAPSTPSGSFARIGLGQLIDGANWADAVLLAGDFGKNSETAILLESFIDKFTGPIILANDSLDYFLSKPDALLTRPQTLLVAEFGQLQKLAAGQILIKHSMDLNQLVAALDELSAKTKALIMTTHAGQVMVAAEGQVSTTPTQTTDLIKTASYASVWWLQNPSKIIEGLTTATWECLSGSSA